MNTNNTANLKIIYSLRIRIALRKAGFEPLIEMDNPYKVGLRCWGYEDSDEFKTAFSQIMMGGK